MSKIHQVNIYCVVAVFQQILNQNTSSPWNRKYELESIQYDKRNKWIKNINKTHQVKLVVNLLVENVIRTKKWNNEKFQCECKKKKYIAHANKTSNYSI